MINKKIAYSFIGIVVVGIILISCSFLLRKPIETLSANVNIQTDQILANFNGKIKDFKYETYDKVNTGDIIATVQVVQPPELCKTKSSERQQNQAITEYENAAIMYKDGIITQEQYDSSLEKLRKTQDKKNCNETTTTENIYAFKTGKIFYNEYNIGDTVHQDDVIAEIEINKPQIYAYFSPRKSKKIKVGMPAEITIVKYPEKKFTGIVSNIDAVDIMGRLIVIDINEDLNEINLKNGDAAVVKIVMQKL